MLQSRGCPDFRKKALAAESRAELRVQDLNGDVAVMLQIDRAEYGCHSARPQLVLDVVAVGDGRGKAREDIGHRHQLRDAQRPAHVSLALVFDLLVCLTPPARLQANTINCERSELIESLDGISEC